MEYIYLLKNKVTNRGYVGRTCHLNLRPKQHMNSLKIGKHYNELMQEDFNKYGAESFEFSVLQEFDPILFFNSHLERNWIIKLETYKKCKGYNYKDQAVIRYLNANNIPKVTTVEKLVNG